MSENSHDIVVTGIVVKDGKYLITRRALTKKNFPGKWTVPGGNLEKKDYLDKEKDIGIYWYNVLEEVLRREIREETGLEIRNIGYVTSMTFIKPDNSPTVIISLFAEHSSGEVVLNNESIDYKWVSLDEAGNYDLLDGIYEELVMVDKLLKGNKINEWRKGI